jgi:AcrR family transcriptional regulator
MVSNRLSRDEKRQQTRSDILVAAGRVFAQNGYANTSLDQVAAEAGYTKGAIYSNFQNKEELILAVWEARFSSNRGDANRFSELIVSGDFGAAREFLGAQGETLNLLLLELWVHAIRNEGFRSPFAGQLKSQRDRTAEAVMELCAQADQGAPRRPADLAKIAMACEIGLSMLTAIEPDTSPGLYVDCLAALLGESPFTPESAI